MNTEDWDLMTLRRWKHRRAMTWATLIFALLVFPAATILNEHIIEMAGAFYTFCTAVVSVYIGFSTVDDKWNSYLKRNNKDEL